jgi:hypothetical protein
MWDPGWEIESRRPRFYRCYICTWPRALMCTVQHTPTARQASQDANARQLLLLATRVQGCALILRALYRVYLKFTGFVGQRHNLLMMIRNTHRTQIGRGPYLPQHPSSQLVTSRSRTGEDGMKIKRRWDDHPYEPHLLAECVSIVVATMVVILRVLYDGAGRAKLEPAI